MIVCLPHFSGDVWLISKNLNWYLELDDKVPYDCVLSSDINTDSAEVRALARKYFKKVYEFKHDRIRETKWPFVQNHAFMSLAWYMNQSFPKQSFLWTETDSVPLCSGWIQQIEECHTKAGKPFTGHWNHQTGVFNGVAVYPPDISRYAPKAMTAALVEGQQPPWDVYCSKEVERHLNKANHLFQHIWRDDTTGEAYHFETAEQVAKVIRPGVVLFHRCKDFSLVNVLRSRGPAILESRVKTESDKVIRVQRTGAIGDVITATVVADKLAEKGFKVSFAADPNASIPVRNHPAISELTGPISKPDVNLDGAYETSNERSKPCGHIYIDAANRQLASRGIRLDYANSTPRIQIAAEQKASVKLEGLKPWILVVPKSGSFVNRTVPNDIWYLAAEHKIGTWFWTGLDPAPSNFIDLKCHNLERLAACIANADLVVSVDSGPLHIAAALGIPVIGIAQSNIPWLTDQRDWSMVSAPLGCINCHEHKCPIDSIAPPCGRLRIEELVALIQSKWQARSGSTISAIIPIYKPNVERLNKCLTHVLPQVDEIVVSVDGDGAIPAGVVQSQRIKWVQNQTGQRQGFGKTVNRAARQSSGRFLLMLNDDVYLKPDAVSKLKSAMDEKTAIVAGRLWYPDGTIQHGGGYRNAGDVGWGHLDVKQKVPTIRKQTELEFVTLAAALIRREAFYQVNAFDERYDCYCEDNELCLNVRRSGWKIIYEPSSEGIHDESQTTGAMKKELGKASYAIFRERWNWYFTKNRGTQLGTFE